MLVLIICHIIDIIWMLLLELVRGDSKSYIMD